MKAEEWFNKQFTDDIKWSQPYMLTLEQADRYAREFAAEQLREAADAYEVFCDVDGETGPGRWLRKRAAALKG